MSEFEKMDGHSADIVGTNVAALQDLFPEAFTEAKGADGATAHRIDFEVLRQLLGDRVVVEGEGKYGLSWHGKDRARQLALTPSAATLRPAPEESVDWDTTQNIMIEGDNLEVLKLLQKSYAGRVKLIYIDPPYNTGKDFVYPDDFRDTIGNYLTLTGQSGDGGGKLTSNPETSGRFHTDWLNMMYPRLKLARDLLRDDGVIAISIDDRELSNLQSACSEIFGKENIIGVVIWKNVTDNNPTNVATEHEYLLFVAKSKSQIEKEWKSKASDVKDLLIRIGREFIDSYEGDLLQGAYDKWFREHKSELWPLDRYKYIDKGGIYTGSQSVHNPGKEGYRYDLIHDVTLKPCKQPLMGYRFPKTTMDELVSEGRILFGDDESKIVELKVYAYEFQEKLSSLIELDTRLGAYDLREDFPEEVKVFNNPKPIRLLTSFFPFVLKTDGDIILDFFAGSGSTGRAIYRMNVDKISRRYILVQLPELLDKSTAQQKSAAELCFALNRPASLAELTKERLRRAGAKIKAENPLFTGDTGFRVFKLDRSNIRAWNPDTKDVAADLLHHADHLIERRTDQDVLYEVLLKQGLDLCVPIQESVISVPVSQLSVVSGQGGGGTDNLPLTTDSLTTDHRIWCIGGGVLFVCLSGNIDRSAAEAIADGIAAWHKALAPATDTRLIFKDSGFKDDVAKTNLTAILAQHGLKDVRSI